MVPDFLVSGHENMCHSERWGHGCVLPFARAVNEKRDTVSLLMATKNRHDKRAFVRSAILSGRRKQRIADQKSRRDAARAAEHANP